MESINPTTVPTTVDPTTVDPTTGTVESADPTTATYDLTTSTATTMATTGTAKDCNSPETTPDVDALMKSMIRCSYKPFSRSQINQGLHSYKDKNGRVIRDRWRELGQFADDEDCFWREL
jgi:hypothetical protein